MAVGIINPYAPSEAVEKAFLGWEEMLEVPTPIRSLFGIGAPVDTMSYEGSTAEETTYAAEVGTGGWTDGTTSVGLPVTAASAQFLTNYAVLKVEDELVIVESVDRTANTIDVYARGEGSTVGAAHIAATVIAITGYNLPLGVKDIESVKNELDTYINYVAKNTVPSLNYTKEDIGINRKYYGEEGSADYVAQQMLERDKDLLRSTDKSLLFSSAKAGTGSGATGTPAMTKGLMEEATERGNVVTSFGELTSFSQINAAVVASQAKFGRSNVILCSLAFRNKIQDLSAVETQLPAPLNRLAIAIGDQVSVLNTNVGQLVAVWSADMPDDKAIILNTANLSRHPLVNFTTPGGDKTTAQASVRNDQAFDYDTLMQGGTFYKNTNRDMTLITGITY